MMTTLALVLLFPGWVKVGREDGLKVEFLPWWWVLAGKVLANKEVTGEGRKLADRMIKRWRVQTEGQAKTDALANQYAEAMEKGLSGDEKGR